VATHDLTPFPFSVPAAVLGEVDDVLAADPTARRTPRETRRVMTASLFALRTDVRAAAAPGEPAAPLVEEIEDRLVRLNLRVAEAVAWRYAGRGLAVEDLEQTAAVALLQAVRRFDQARSDDFLTFAVPTIRGSVQKHFRDRGWMIRPPRSIQELQTQVVRVRDSLGDHDGSEPSVDEIARALGVPSARVAEALQASGCFQPLTLDLPATTGTPMTGEEDERDRDGFRAADARLLLAPVVRALPERDRRLVQLRFFDELSQREIGARLGMSQTQVSRHLDRVLRELGERLEPPGLLGPLGSPGPVDG